MSLPCISNVLRNRYIANFRLFVNSEPKMLINLLLIKKNEPSKQNTNEHKLCNINDMNSLS